ncbi:Aste57867_1478 [Aphanomyces stellatus]|uniref:Aste57867_1478 protein n=1 Tax=Aphanomyces stellatus TaxID=120398 RepID=A0A485KAF0_9STRA|nr:hypothetical protein As57867_001477 [Aphanomyces stellatus]VFT78694.1 Aste57867_1478 [Aphanomyces stellatus]
MHTLCEFHRTKACAHQKKLDAKRRTEKLKLLESKKSMQHHHHGMKTTMTTPSDMHMWKEDENRMPMHDTKYKPMWDAPAHDAALYGSVSSVGQQYGNTTPREMYDLPHTNTYDDRYKFPMRQTTTPNNTNASSSSPLNHILQRKDDPFRHHFGGGGREASFPAPSYPSPTSYATSAYVDSTTTSHYDKQQRLTVPQHMTTGTEFDSRYNDYYDDVAPYNRAAATSFGQYPPQPVYHQ